MSWLDRRQFDAICALFREGFRVLPRPVNRASLTFSLKLVGAETRRERWAPPAA
ncbi:hypothetical protein D3C83_270270 [compost metagenome]